MTMHTQVLRWADPATCERLPGPCSNSSQLAPGTNELRLTLPDLTPGTLVIPSFAACLTEPYAFTFSLDGVALPAVPSSAPTATTPAASTSTTHAQMKTHLDWFEVTRSLAAPQLTLQVPATCLHVPHLISVSIRPLDQSTPTSSLAAATQTSAPPLLSQRQAGAEIRGRICSPTALAMVLKHHDRSIDWLEFVAECRDPATGMYGLWPLCIVRAATSGCLGAVQAFSGWHEVTPLLAAGLPVVASIRYPAGGLTDAPMASTGGHLVLVYGVDDRWVLVNDPAAPDRDSVARRYLRSEFEKAWFDHRGAGYLVLR